MTETVESNVDDLELYSDNHPFRLPLRRRSFESESDFGKFIKGCERLVRSSLEYKEWKQYIIEVLGVNTCMITSESMADCSVEVHHHLPSLYNIVKVIINKKVSEEQEFSTFDICSETIKLHFQNKIGYVTLIKSMHEKFHNKMLDVPIEIVKGNYTGFLAEYGDHFDDDDMDVINSRLSVAEGNCSWSRNNYIINEAVSE